MSTLASLFVYLDLFVTIDESILIMIVTFIVAIDVIETVEYSCILVLYCISYTLMFVEYSLLSSKRPNIKSTY